MTLKRTAYLIIDSHTHVFPDELAERAVHSVCTSHKIPAYGKGTVSDLRVRMQQQGVSRSLILGVATRPKQVPVINDSLTRTSREYPELTALGALHPAYGKNLEVISTARAVGLKGFKLHSFFQDFQVNDHILDDVYAAVTEQDLPLVFHSGYEIRGDERTTRPQDFLEIRERFPRLKMILAHLGGNLMHDLVEEILVGKNFYFDTSYIAQYIAQEQFVNIINTHGAEQILFASDSPWGDIEKHVKLVMNAKLSQAQKELIFNKNAIDLFKL
jgi:predicted TIM-barrel fold metal-dependent hydrolase